MKTKCKNCGKNLLLLHDYSNPNNSFSYFVHYESIGKYSRILSIDEAKCSKPKPIDTKEVIGVNTLLKQIL